jgi:hypothetical protein
MRRKPPKSAYRLLSRYATLSPLTRRSYPMWERPAQEWHPLRRWMPLLIRSQVCFPAFMRISVYTARRTECNVLWTKMRRFW